MTRCHSDPPGATGNRMVNPRIVLEMEMDGNQNHIKEKGSFRVNMNSNLRQECCLSHGRLSVFEIQCLNLTFLAVK